MAPRKKRDENSLDAPAAASWFTNIDDQNQKVPADEVVAHTLPSTSTTEQHEPQPALGDLFADDRAAESLVEEDDVDLEQSHPVDSPEPVRPPQRTGISITGKRERSGWGNYKNLDAVWPIVEQLRDFVSTDAPLQAIAKKLQLTRDAQVNAAQKDEILNALRKNIASRGGISYQPEEMGPALDLIYDEIVGISVLGDLWRDDNITEIMVDRWDRVVVESNGRLVVTDISFRSPDHANDVARSLALRVSDRSVSPKIPLVTAELPQARVSICYGPVVRGGLSITIRKFRPLLSLDSLLANGSLNGEVVELMRDLVTARATILVSGGTGTGKTTIINLLSNFIPDTERVITIEDSFELQLTNTHVVALQTKEAASSDDQVNVTLTDLLRNSLRMRPDRIIVGEIREGEGASTMLAAANTGHDGTMTTLHANSPSMALNERLTDLVRQVRSTPDDVAKRTIASAFDAVVQVSRTARGLRYISEIAVLDGSGFVDGMIRPISIIIGEEQSDGTIKFSRVGSIPEGSRVAKKLAAALVSNRRRWS